MSSLISSCTFLTYFIILPKVHRARRALWPELCGSGGAAQAVEGVHDAGSTLLYPVSLLIGGWDDHLVGQLTMMQAETFASNLRENLDKVRQTEAFKTYNSTFQLLSRAPNITFETRLKYSEYPHIPDSNCTIFQIASCTRFWHTGASCLTASSTTSQRQWMWWTKCEG